MLASEYGQFEALIRRLESIFGKSIDDDAMQAYWGSLRDLSFATIQRRVDEHVKRAKFFPKPAELRPKETAPVERDARAAQMQEAADQRSIRQWQEDFLRHPLPTKWRYLDAYVARTEVVEDRSSVKFAERMTFARDIALDLLRQGGREFLAGEPRLSALATRLTGLAP